MNIHDLIARRACTSAIPPAPLPQALRDQRLNRANMHRPLVSLIVTSYNYESYIEECLRSVTRQTYDNWECIIVDDQSTDSTVDRVRAFMQTPEANGRFRLIEGQENRGQMEAFREGLTVASGSFVVLLDADDVLLDDFLEAHMHAHLSVATVAFTSSNQYQINGAGEIIGGQHMDHQSKGYYRHVRKTTFQRGFWIWATSSSMVYRRSTVDLIMPRDGATFRICADYYIAHFCHLIGDSLLIPSVHGCYRRHGANNFGSNPVFGNINSVGNLDKHPPHDLFRMTMIRHILGNYDLFYPIYMGPGLIRLVLRMIKPRELPNLVARYPAVFKRPLRHYLWLAAKMQWEKWRTPVSEKFKILSVPTAEELFVK
ncbi:glycosyltransferase [Desulfovibrio sulfodismutans]|uniref:Glycosyltransferase n=1 Tax=Desulfolutivibrio sulfodismutans TaxID=63561 RepID=A0A7K3NJ37_9BACT|nr:glycosyltransferase [Desulfolutivibrio sulfodismutans]NDY56107.1 glycosyltransferase [Desulfolutivibrio sulfodismutans]QLA13161.1 glycosyltransferase [Desulfolutivibrio sulfodismutans DSM 3696]